MTAPKKLERSLPVWLDVLVGPIMLDFVAPFPLDVSLKRLKQQEDTRYFRKRKLMVDLLPDDADTFGFHVKHRGGAQAAVEARGYLKRWETDSTFVTARVNLTHGNLLLFAVGLVFAFGAIAAIYRQYALWFLVPLALIMLVNVYVTRRQRHEIAHQIEKALLADMGEDIPSMESNW